MNTKKIPVLILVRLAVLIAMNVILMNYLGIHTEYFKISFSFVPLAVCGMLYGPVWGAVCGGAGDLLNCAVSSYGWYPPLTLSACLNGLVYGLLLRKHGDSLPHIISAVLIFQVLISQCLNTWFLTLLYGTPYAQLFATRIPQTLIMIPVQIVVIRLIGNPKFIKTLSGE